MENAHGLINETTAVLSLHHKPYSLLAGHYSTSHFSFVSLYFCLIAGHSSPTCAFFSHVTPSSPLLISDVSIPI